MQGVPCMKLRQLEAALQEVEPFPKPSIMLEQYPTPADLAARMLYTAEASFGELEGRVVVDLGAGCGVLSIGASLLGAEHVLAVEIDPSAATVAASNASEFEVGVDVLLGDVTGGGCLGAGGRADTVVMNPPFGTKVKGVDMLFLQRALALVRAGGAVYSMHKSSTREHVMAKGREWGSQGSVLAQLWFPLPRVHGFHKHHSVDVQVDLWRFHVPGTGAP